MLGRIIKIVFHFLEISSRVNIKVSNRAKQFYWTIIICLLKNDFNKMFTTCFYKYLTKENSLKKIESRINQLIL